MPNARRRRRRLIDESDDRDPVQEIIERVLETPQARGLLEQFQHLLDRAGNAIDPAARPRQRTTIPPRPRPRPQAAPPPDPLKIAREVLHLDPVSPVTEAQIKQRRRELAAVCHPDKGGSQQAMQKINLAADLLLASLK